MASTAQINANRANAQLSTGPRPRPVKRSRRRTHGWMRPRFSASRKLKVKWGLQRIPSLKAGIYAISRLELAALKELQEARLDQVARE